MDSLLEQAHAILQFGHDLEEIMGNLFLIITTEKDFRTRIDKKAIGSIDAKAWVYNLPAKGQYFRISHYIAALKQFVKESKRIPRALEQMANSSTLDTIQAFCRKACRPSSSVHNKYGDLTMYFRFRCITITHSPDKTSVCLEALHFAQACPLFQRSFRHFISRVSLPLKTAAKQRISEFEEEMDKLSAFDYKFYSRITAGIRAECAQVVEFSLIEIAPIKQRRFLLPSQQRLLEVLKRANHGLTYDDLTYEAGIGSRSTVARGLKILKQLGLAKTLPGGGTIYINKAIPDTSGSASEDI
jgi:hypothetical protein